MANANKNKGKSYERDVAKYLSNLFNNSFLRNFDSGAYLGKTNSDRRVNLTENQIQSRTGDIIVPDGWKNISIECKAYKDFPFNKLLQQDCCLLDTWIEQADYQTFRDDFISIIIFKINNKGQYVCVNNFVGIDKSCALQYKDYFIFDKDKFFIYNKDIVERICSGDN